MSSRTEKKYITNSKPEIHGGDLNEAQRKFGKPEQGWIDLSTGVNPKPYPVENIPLDCFHRLPYNDPAVVVAIQQYYGDAPYALCAGTQQAIQILPNVLPKLPVLVPDIGYKEHESHWRKAGGTINTYAAHATDEAEKSIEQALEKDSRQHLVVINPNNPTGIMFSCKQLRDLAGRLASGATMIVDEAFIDLTPDRSLLNLRLPSNIIVLRSFGKFFGLAGIRLGFVFAHSNYLAPLSERFGLWPANGPALTLGARALMDRAWQGTMVDAIKDYSTFTSNLFATLMLKASAIRWASKGLYLSYVLSQTMAQSIYEAFAVEGILLRYIPIQNNQVVIRVGLICPENKRDVERVSKVIETISRYKI